MTAPTRPSPTFAEIEDAHREAKTRAAVLVKFFEAVADKAGSEQPDLEMHAAFGLESLAREILAALDTMMQGAYALMRRRDVS